MPKLTVTVITRNEAVNLAAALESAAWADELIVVDAHSTDETVSIARGFTPRVEVRDWTGYVEQKNHAAAIAANDWILSIDADERVTPALSSEIRALLAQEPPARGYQVPRVSFYLGCWIRSTDWYPDHQLRLYDRRSARWAGRHVHESVEVDGPVARLRGELQHHPYRDVSHHLRTIDRYTTLAAQQLHEDGKRIGALGLVARPAAAFVRNYVLRGGVRDGGPGLLVSLLNSYYVLLKFAKLWEMERLGRTGTDRDVLHPD